ncbi:MAG: hypothetical protein H8E18_03825, partial [FCB group bacterium]|nr:hypothetical protein [FCB group bacterium]
MKRSITFKQCLIIFAGIALLGPADLLAESQVNTCLDCHMENDIMPGDFHKEDVHQHAEISCAGCHGGDSQAEDMDESMSPDSGYIGIPSRQEMPAFCGRCHSKIEYMRV